MNASMQHSLDGVDSEQVAASSKQSRNPTPSIDTGSAQVSKVYEDLPSIVQEDYSPERSPCDTRRSTNNKNNTTAPTITSQQRADSSLAPTGITSFRSTAFGDQSDQDYDRDPLTGRRLSKKPRTCLRCLSKNIRCTLQFEGKELEPRCSACRRSGINQCVRQALQEIWPENTIEEQKTRFAAPKPRPVKRSIFHVNTKMSPTQPYPADHTTGTWGEVLEDHHADDIIYVNGEPIERRDVDRMALPSFRDVAVDAAAAAATTAADDEEVHDDDDGYNSDPDPETEAGAAAAGVADDMPWCRTVGWRDYLPIQENRSLAGEEDDVKERLRREDGSIDPEAAAALAEDWREHHDRSEQDDQDNGKYDDRLKYLQRIRRYRPRENHLNEMLGETY